MTPTKKPTAIWQIQKLSQSPLRRTSRDMTTTQTLIGQDAEDVYFIPSAQPSAIWPRNSPIALRNYPRSLADKMSNLLIENISNSSSK